ncbi:MAG: DUF4097 domain-containing protein [Acidobacteriota bacterium]|nr:DUF4097 domain-containing protein [Acidobacteriota bacterium]
MRHLKRRLGSALLLTWVSACLMGHVAAEEEEFELLSDQSEGILELQGETRLRIDAIRGHISLRRSAEGEMRFAAVREENRREEMPILLWVRDRELVLAPPEDAADERYYLEITIPAELATFVDTTDSTLSSAGLAGDLSLIGKQSRTHVRGQQGALTIEQEGGTLDVDQVALESDLRLADVRGRIQRLDGPLDLVARESTIELIDANNTVSLELEQTKLVASRLQSRGEIHATGGTVDIRECSRGFSIELDETPLTLTDIGGPVEVDTNASVRFHNLTARLRVHGYGAPVYGKGARFGVDVETTEAEVTLEDLGGNSSVRGSSLRLTIDGVKAQNLTIETNYSSIEAKNIDAELTISNDFGDISIKGAVKPVTVMSRGGSVRAHDLSGAVKIEGEGELFEAVWLKAPADGQNVIINESGDVRVALATDSGMKIAAETEYGEVVSSLPGLEMSGDNKSATGNVGGSRGTSTLQAKAVGSVYIDGIAVVGGN